jgi:hypothetical protein
MRPYFLTLSLLLISLPVFVFSQNQGRTDVAQKVNNAANKINNIIAVFQPYLLKARQLYYDAKQLGGDVKSASKSTFGKHNSGNNLDSVQNGYQNGYQNNSGNSNNSGYSNNSSSTNNNGYTNNSQTSQGNNGNQGYTNNTGQNNNNSSNYNSNPQTYLPGQSMPVNNPASVNNDGTGNWGNQNNGLYGNCLDVLTGTVMGIGEAESSPSSVDVIFIAANGSYQLWTPNYARNEVAAEYTSRSTTESVTKWSTANETEIGLTRITLAQFDQIQNNSQVLNAAKNVQNYASSITEFSKLDGKVYAVKAELETRTVYGLIAIVKQVGTDGSNGYLKIKIKAQGVDNGNGQLNASLYQR